MLQLTESQKQELEARIQRLASEMDISPEEALYVAVQTGLDAVEKIGAEKGLGEK